MDIAQLGRLLLAFDASAKDSTLLEDLPLPCRGRDSRKPVQLGEPRSLIIGRFQEHGIGLIWLHDSQRRSRVNSESNMVSLEFRRKT
jgi:hypothetical protein